MNALVQAEFSGDSATGIFFKAKIQSWGGKIGELVADNPDLAKQISYAYVKSNEVKEGTGIGFESSANNGRSFNTILEANYAATEYSEATRDKKVLVNFNVTLPEQPDTVVRYSIIMKKINDATPAVDSNVLVNLSAPGFDASGFKTNTEIGFDPNAPIPPAPLI